MNLCLQTFDITLEKNLEYVIFATFHHFRQTILGNIRSITLEKNFEDTNIVTNLSTELNNTFDIFTSRADQG